MQYFNYNYFFQENKILLYACRNCDYKMPAENNCIYVNKLMHEIDELRHINPEVVQVRIWMFSSWHTMLLQCFSNHYYIYGIVFSVQASLQQLSQFQGLIPLCHDKYSKLLCHLIYPEQVPLNTNLLLTWERESLSHHLPSNGECHKTVVWPS